MYNVKLRVFVLKLAKSGPHLNFFMNIRQLFSGAKLKSALITIGFIADLLKTLVALKQAVFEKKNNIRTVFVSPVSRINGRIIIHQV